MKCKASLGLHAIDGALYQIAIISFQFFNSTSGMKLEMIYEKDANFYSTLFNLHDIFLRLKAE